MNDKQAADHSGASAPGWLIEDVLAPGLRVVFCGTALGRTSHRERAYYAHKRNNFWPTLHEVGFTTLDRPLRPDAYARAPDFGIGLTDLNKTEFGNDHELTRSAYDVAGLRRKIERFGPGVLAFTSLSAGRAFLGSKAGLGWAPARIGATRIYVLPSTSPAAQWRWVEQKHHWHALAEAVRA